MKRMITGIVLIFISVMTYLPNAGKITFFQNDSSLGQFLGDLAFFCGYFWLGIIGLILLIFGYRAYQREKNKNKIQNNYDENKESNKVNPNKFNRHDL